MTRNEKEKRISTLIAGSMLSGALKNILKKNLKKYDDAMLENIANSLAMEGVALENLAADLMRFDTESQKRWEDVAKSQIAEADKSLEDIYQDIVSSSA